MGIFEFLRKNSRSNLLVKMEEVRKDSIEASLNEIHKFYNNDIAEYFKDKTKEEKLKDLFNRKSELENNNTYMINIGLGIIGGIAATIVYNSLQDGWAPYEVIIVFFVAFFSSVVLRFIFHIGRLLLDKELQILDEYELKLINGLIEKEISCVIKVRN